MHEPIIDKKLWDEVQYMIANHPGHDRSFKAPGDSEINPLRGIVYCTLCGAGMWRMSYKCAKQRYKYYRCRTVKTNRAGCDNINSVRQTDIEAVVLKELQGLIDRYFDPESIDLTVTSRLDERLRSAEKEKLQMAKKDQGASS